MTLIADPPAPPVSTPRTPPLPEPMAPAPPSKEAPCPAGTGHRLAELIRRGCRYSPVQAHDHLFGNQTYIWGETSSCVMGALYEGLMGTQEIREPVVYVVKERTGVDLTEVRLPHPLYPRSPSRWKLNEILVDLNDRRGWRREQIADWLEKALP